MYSIRLIDRSKDMKYIVEWWKEHGWTPVHPYMLSETGYIVEHEGQPIVAGWYVRTNGGAALLEWIVKNPLSSPKVFERAFDILVDSIEEYAKEDGYLMLITFIEHGNLKKYLTRKKYLEGDKALDIYVKGL